MTPTLGVLEFFVRGGLPFMLPLLLASVAVIAFALDRVLRFRNAWVNYDDFLETVKETIEERGIAAAKEEIAQIPGPVARAWPAAEAGAPVEPAATGAPIM